MKYILKKSCRDDFVDELFTMMDDGDSPETSNRVLRPTGADHFRRHHAEYENRIPQEPDQVQAAIDHNKAYPCLIDELSKKRSLADAGMKKQQRERVCHYYDPNCQACRELMLWQELPEVTLDPNCKACRKLQAWRDNKRLNLKPPCSHQSAKTKSKKNGRQIRSNTKKFKNQDKNPRKALVIKDSEVDFADDSRSRRKPTRIQRHVLAINDSKIEFIDDAKYSKKPKKRERECDSCSSEECRNKKRRPEDESESSSKASLNSGHNLRNDDSKSSYQDYGEMGEEPMVFPNPFS